MPLSPTAPRGLKLARAATIALCGGLALFYAVFAFQYFLGTITGGHEWWNLFQGWVVSEAFSFGAGSVSVDQEVVYYGNRWLMLVHATMGAFCLAIGWTQFVSGWRKAWPGTHRMLGKVYLVTVIASMVFGLLHLATIPVRSVFSGAAFGFGLWGLDLIVLFSAVMAYLAIRRRDVRQHQGWMAINYALICATPTLRLTWLIFGLTTAWTQAEINLAIGLVLLPLTMTLGMVWYSFQYMKKPRPVAAGQAVAAE